MLTKIVMHPEAELRRILDAMPKNRMIYFGVLVVAASVLLFVSKWILNFVEPILPYSAGVGAALIVIGVLYEGRKSKEAAKPVDPPV